ncbi:MAG: hypothetical protein EGR90_00100 [Lachnospiraceae bacterium]|nr:hypothetical protein [Lachnospiraceae bacterium]
METRYLFRGKTICGDWVRGLLANNGDKWYISNNAGRPFAFKIRPDTICQCTGLKDKNGKLIWENDIIKAWSQGTCAKGKIKQRIDGTWIMYPAWQKGEMWYLCPDNNGETTVEVVGNVFDNPELLEV